jgi:hypothetical protein
VAAIEAALLPIINQGIQAAYRLSEQGVDELVGRMKGVDKKAVADSIYRLLPEKIHNHDLSLVKSLVTQERFEDLVQNAFDSFDRFYDMHHRHFKELFEEWQAENPPEPTPTEKDV